MPTGAAVRTARGVASVIERVAAAVAAVLLWLIFAVLLTELVSRNLLGHSLAGSWEIAAFMLAAMMFLGLAPALAAGTHVRVAVLPSMLHGRTARIAEACVLTVALTITSYATWALVGLASTSVSRGSLSWELSLPMAWPQFAVALGMALFALSFALRLVVTLFDATQAEG